MGQQNPYKVVLTIIIGLLLLYWFTQHNFFLVGSLVVGLVALLSDWAAIKISAGWMQLAQVLSRIFPPIVLGAVYLFILTPLALMARLSKRRNELNLTNQATTLFKEVNKNHAPKTFEKMW
ncbi:MAG: hypothetical protein EAY81_08690 [Bacteroidetes bacterium]|nr:MAG: hypothetical protein EAY81_08690 [Bacteroidota bacterium]